MCVLCIQEQIVEKLQLRSLELLKSATRRADEEVQSFSQQHWDTAGIVEAHMTLANFCDKILREDEQNGGVGQLLLSNSYRDGDSGMGDLRMTKIVLI